MKKSNIVFSLSFLIVIFFFFFYNVLVDDKTFSYNENRELTQQPKLSVETLLNGSYMKDVEVYVNDQIAFRDMFVKLSTNVKLMLGQKEVNNVYICEDYLIEKFEKSKLDGKLLEQNLRYIEEFMTKYDNSYISIIPTSTEILGYKLSRYTENINQKETIERIVQGKNNIDIYSKLLEHNREDIYYRTDHHWTSLGAYYAYVSICEKLGLSTIDLEDFNVEVIDNEFSGTIQSKVNLDFGYDTLYRYTVKGLQPKYQRVVDENFKEVSNTLYDESKLETKEKYAVYIGGNSAITRIYSENIKEDKGRLLLIKDSYSHSLVPFLTNHYSEIVLIDLRYFNMSLNQFLQEENEINDILLIWNLANFVENRTLIKLIK